VLTANAQDWDPQQQVENLGPDEPRCAMAYLAWIASELVPQPAFRRETSYRRSLNRTRVGIVGCRECWPGVLAGSVGWALYTLSAALHSVTPAGRGSVDPTDQLPDCSA